MAESLPSAPESSKPARSASRRSGDPRKRADPRKSEHKKRLLGHTVPRIFTPPLVDGPPGPCGCGCALTEETTRGFSAVDFATEVCKVKLRPWQRWLLIHALETVWDEELDCLRFRFRNIVTLVARQNGKSTLSVVLSLWAMYARGVRVVLSAAQDLDTAEKIWQDGVDMVEETDDNDEPVRPDLYELKDHVSLVNGKKALILETGERWKVKAASRKAGRGLSGDLIILDELREQQNWLAWSAITKTTMARPLAQVWCFSNAGDITSVVLRHLRLMAHKMLDDPDGIVLAEAERIVAAEAERLGAPDEYDLDSIHSDPELADLELDDLEVSVDDLFLAEWSARPDRGKWDREGWAEANPSLGYGDTTERVIASACATDPEWEFRTEVLCQWPEGALSGIYEPGTWEATRNVSLETPAGEKYISDDDKLVGDVRATFDVARDGSRTYIAWGGKRKDGRFQGEIVAARPGTDWVGGWLMSQADRIESVSAQERGAPASDVLETLRKDPKFTIPILTIGGARLTAVHGRVAELVKKGDARHNEQPVLDNSVAMAKLKPLGDNDVIDRRRSGGDAAPAIAWEFAIFEASEPPTFVPPPPPPPRALSTREGHAGSRRRRSVDDFDPATSGF